MAGRREEVVVLSDRGVDRTFRVREMSASQLERWTLRAVLLLAGTGVEIPEGFNIEDAGRYLQEKGLSALGNVDPDRAFPLMDQLLGCCSVVVGKMATRLTPENVDDHVQDMRTLLALKGHAFRVNFDFFGKGDGGKSSSQGK